MTRDNRNPTDLRAQQRAAEEQEKQAKLRADIKADDYRWLMESEKGRRIMWHLLSDCRVFGSTFHTSAAQAAFNEGQRNVGLWLLDSVMKFCPEQFTRMQDEAKA